MSENVHNAEDRWFFFSLHTINPPLDLKMFRTTPTKRSRPVFCVKIIGSHMYDKIIAHYVLTRSRLTKKRKKRIFFFFIEGTKYFLCSNNEQFKKKKTTTYMINLLS